MPERHTTIMAGIPAHNMALYHRIRFVVGDPVVLIELVEHGRPTATLILRDIEMGRARAHARADQVACPAQFAPEGGLSGDRETATAESAAEFLRRQKITRVTADRSLPMIYVHALRAAGIDVVCDLDLGVSVRPRQGCGRNRTLTPVAARDRAGDGNGVYVDRTRQSRSPGRVAPGRRTSDVRARAGGDRRVSARARLHEPHIDRGRGAGRRGLPQSTARVCCTRVSR